MYFSFHFTSHLFLYLFLTILLEHEQKLPERTNKAQACDQSPLGEEKSHQGEELKEDTRPLWHDNNGGGVEEEPEVSELTLSPLRSKGKMKIEKKAAASGWGIPTTEEAAVLVDGISASEEASPAPEHYTQDMGLKWNFGTTKDVPAEPHTAAGEAIPAEEPCFAAPEGAFHTDEPYNIVPEEEPIPEDAFPVREAVSNEDSQAEAIIEVFDDAEEHGLNQHDKVPYELYDPYDLTSGLDVAPMHNAPAEDAEFLIPPPRPALSTVCDDFDIHSPPLASSSTVTSVLEAGAPGAPTEDSHTITLKILSGSKVLRSIAFIRACTRTAILNEAKAYCVKRAQDDQCLGTLLAKEYDLALISLKIHGYDMDLSTYEVESLSSLVRAVEKTSIPRFTLRITEL